MERQEPNSDKTSVPATMVYSLLAAFRFLTLLPISWRADNDVHYLKSSLYFYPVVGAVIGVIVGGIGFQLTHFLPFNLVAVIVIILLAVVSGCLHIDGLADSCDGLLSGRPREKMLVIMRDSNVGAMGVIGIVAVFFLKYAAVSSLDRSLLFEALILMPLSGRISMLQMMAYLKYVRGKDGIGSSFFATDSKNIRMAAASGLLWFVVCLCFMPMEVIIPAVGLTLIMVFLFSWYCHKILGGFTGDTLGAVCELSEAVVAIAMVISAQAL